MAKIQCKMCGGALDLPDDVTVGKCPWCGSMTTFPKITSDHVEHLYSRAEHYRHAGDFDKAMSAYEAIVRETPDDAEAYWGLVLSRFGIEYVEDPVSHERIPTCHRVQYESILADGDYQSALEHASDQGTRDMYEAEATRIAKIQKDILAISSQEKPFDVFICYKETTDGGSRTKDSTDAQEIYYQLTNAGYKVFFSRITLEDKLGQQYEPYIFAALNSAKVMLVIGSKKEYFNAVWVKNEWSRFLSLMKKDRSKLLIPCYKDMDVYDLPEELSMLQSQDMSKIGFIQDLIRGIQKVIGKETENTESPKTKAKIDISSASVLVEPLLKRARLFRDTENYDKEKQYFEKAIQVCDKILDKEPENGDAYLYKLLAENGFVSIDELINLPIDRNCCDKYIILTEKNKNRQILSKIFQEDTIVFLLRFAENEIKKQIKFLELKNNYYNLLCSLDYSCIQYIRKIFEKSDFSNEEESLLDLEFYKKFKETVINSGYSDADEYFKKNPMFLYIHPSNIEYKKLQEIIIKLNEISSYPEATKLYQKCQDTKKLMYESAKRDFQLKHQDVIQKNNKNISPKEWEKLEKFFNGMVDIIPEASEAEDQCKYNAVNARYNIALKMMNNASSCEELRKAKAIFGKIELVNDDAKSMIEICTNKLIKQQNYEKALTFFEKKQYKEALELFKTVDEYIDVSKEIAHCNKMIKKQEIITVIVIIVVIIITCLTIVLLKVRHDEEIRLRNELHYNSYHY